jgi:hypothetical protein
MLDGGSLIPRLGGLTAWSEVAQAIADVSGDGDAGTLLGDPRICVVLDGWSEFASGSGSNERARAMRVLNRGRVIANARYGTDSDSVFRVWALDPLPIPAVQAATWTALPGAPPPDAALLELLRLPLALALFIMLGGSASTCGELLARLHAHLSRDFPERFRDVIAGAAASVSLTGERSYARLQNEIRDRASRASIAEPLRLLAGLGTLEDRAGTTLPVHDLYWSWLSGLGLLGEHRIAESLPYLSTRESYRLALESGARPSAGMVSVAGGTDAVFASMLNAARDPSPVETNDFAQVVGAMFADPRLPVRCRAALAGLHSREPSLLRPSLDIMTEVFDARLYVGAFESALVIDVIARQGGKEWGPWLEQLAHSGRLEPLFAAAAAIACEGRVPAWTVAHLPELARDRSWKLRAAAGRGANIELARWVAEHYDDAVDAGNIRWLHVNDVLIRCGDDATFQYLLSRFPSLTTRAQEALGFAIVELGDPWVGRFQRVAFQNGGAIQHHKLAEAVSLDIDDATARGWIANGLFELGWRVLIAHHGAAIVYIPALSAMRFLVDPPESLVNEVWRRVGGTMRPKVTQDAINAIARVRRQGVQGIIDFVLRSPGSLPTYHLAQVVRLVKAWEADIGLGIKITMKSGETTTFAEWALQSRFARDKNDSCLRRALGIEPELAIRVVLKEFRHDHRAATEVLSQVKPLTGYHAALFDHLVVNPDLFALIPKLFLQAFDTFSRRGVAARR